MKISISALFGKRCHADRKSSILHNTYEEQTFVHQSKDEDCTSAFDAKTPLRSLIKTEFARLKGQATKEQESGQDATPAENNESESRRQYVWSKIVGKYSKTREAIVGRGMQCLLKNNEPDAHVIRTNKDNILTHPVQYRDIDLGYRHETTYADFIDYLGGDDQPSEFDFGLSTWWYCYPSQNEDLYNEAFSDANDWEIFQHANQRSVGDRSPIPSLYEPLPPLSIISENIQEDSSRPTTSSTDRRDSGEFLRRLQTDSSFGSRLHSRNVSDTSNITLPLSEDYYDLREAPAGENPSKLERTTECGAGRSIYSEHSDVSMSHSANGIDEADEEFVDHGGVSDEIRWLEAPPYVDFEWYKVNDSYESIPFITEEQMDASDENDVGEGYTDQESQKGHFLHVEQPVDEDNQSFVSTYPDDQDVSTRSYGKFDAAFTQQVKDYSKLLDDLADPDATAQALELVSSRLSLYLNNNSSADIAFGRCAESEAAEKRQRAVLPDLSDLDAFLENDDDDDDDDGDEDADSGFHVGRTQVFSCPKPPKSTPFADLEQFIGDDDLDIDMDPVGPTKPILKSFKGWTVSGNNDDSVGVLPDRTALRTRPPLRRTC